MMAGVRDMGKRKIGLRQVNRLQRLRTKRTASVTFGLSAAFLVVLAAAVPQLPTPSTITDRASLLRNAGGGPPGGEVASMVVDPRSDQTLYASLVSAGIFKSVDSGASWTETGPDVPSTLSRFELTFDSANPKALFAENLGAYFVTLDGGGSWRTVKATPESLRGWPRRAKRRAEPDIWPKGAVTVIDDALVVRPSGRRGTAYAATSSGVMKTIDNGTSWESVNTGLTGIWSRVVAVAGGSQPEVLLVESGIHRLYRSSDGGESWTSAALPEANEHGYSSKVWAEPAGSIYARVHDKLFKSTDTGSTWTSVAGGRKDITQIVVSPAEPRAMFAATSSQLLKSIDGGEHWTPMTTGLPSGMPMAGIQLDPRDPSRLYATAMFQRVHRSVDGGETWTPLAALRQISIRCEVLPDPDSPNVIYLLTRGTYIESSEGDVFRTMDGGNTWTLVAVSPSGAMPIDFLGLVPSHPATLFAGAQLRGAEAYALFRSTDQGATWARSDAGLPPASPVTSIVADPANPGNLFAGTGRGVFRSSDGGKQWRPTGARQVASPGAQRQLPLER